MVKKVSSSNKKVRKQKPSRWYGGEESINVELLKKYADFFVEQLEITEETEKQALMAAIKGLKDDPSEPTVASSFLKNLLASTKLQDVTVEAIDDAFSATVIHNVAKSASDKAVTTAATTEVGAEGAAAAPAPDAASAAATALPQLPPPPPLPAGPPQPPGAPSQVEFEALGQAPASPFIFTIPAANAIKITATHQVNLENIYLPGLGGGPAAPSVGGRDLTRKKRTLHKGGIFGKSRNEIKLERDNAELKQQLQETKNALEAATTSAARGSVAAVRAARVLLDAPNYKKINFQGWWSQRLNATREKVNNFIKTDETNNYIKDLLTEDLFASDIMTDVIAKIMDSNFGEENLNFLLNNNSTYTYTPSQKNYFITSFLRHQSAVLLHLTQLLQFVYAKNLVSVPPPAPAPSLPPAPMPTGGGAKKEDAKKHRRFKGGFQEMDVAKMYNAQGLVTNLDTSLSQHLITNASVYPNPFSAGGLTQSSEGIDTNLATNIKADIVPSYNGGSKKSSRRK